MARRLFLSTPAPRLVVDPNDSSLTAIAGAVTFSDASRPTNERGEAWRTAATARFVPDDPADRAAYNELYRWVWAHFPRYLWLDEAADAAPANGCPALVRRVIQQGAKRSLGHLACHTRPRELARNLIAQAQHVFVFELPNPDDRDHIARIAGIPREVIEAELGRLEPHGFLWWQQAERRLTVCRPLRSP